MTRGYSLWVQGNPLYGSSVALITSEALEQRILLIGKEADMLLSSLSAQEKNVRGNLCRFFPLYPIPLQRVGKYFISYLFVNTIEHLPREERWVRGRFSILCITFYFTKQRNDAKNSILQVLHLSWNKENMHNFVSCCFAKQKRTQNFVLWRAVYAPGDGQTPRGYIRRGLAQHDFCLGWLEQIWHSGG
jgi:hypothetical protein